MSMFKRRLHHASVNPIQIQSRLGCAGSITMTEGVFQCMGLHLGQGLRVRDSNPAQILRLEAQIAAPHADSIRFDEKLSDLRHQQASEYFQVPLIRLNEIQIVVRVRFTPIQDRFERVLNIRDIEFVCIGEDMVNAVDRLVPLAGTLLRCVALFQGCRMLLVVSS